MRKYERWLVLPDIHIPNHDTKTFEALEAYVADVQKSRNPYTGFLQLGDFLDLDELSRWTKDYEASIKGNLAESFERGNSFLDRWRTLLGEDCRMVILQGNHDYRTVDFGLKFPHLGEHCNFERNLRFEDRRIEYVKSWETGKMFQLGNAYFTHGRFLNLYHSRKMCATFGVCVYYGHTHDVQESSLVQYGNDKTLVGKSLGCLCLYDQTYMKGAPSNWQQAFAEFYIFRDGYFQETTTKIYKHRFVGQNGKIYQG